MNIVAKKRMQVISKFSEYEMRGMTLYGNIVLLVPLLAMCRKNIYDSPGVQKEHPEKGCASPSFHEVGLNAFIKIESNFK